MFILTSEFKITSKLRAAIHLKFMKGIRPQGRYIMQEVSGIISGSVFIRLTEGELRSSIISDEDPMLSSP